MKHQKKGRSSYAGRILWVDLSRKKIWTEPTETYARRWIGGRAVNTAILLDNVKPGVRWCDPENILAFGVGMLAGTLAPGACRVSVDSKNAFNNGIGSANVGGFWGPELKFAGFDHLAIIGRASRPVYLWIADGRAQIRDAGFIWGRTTWETEERIRKTHRDDRVRVAAIGPAGENRVRCACIICDSGCAAGGSGCGAVMGAKNLKAVAVRGSLPISVAHPARFMNAVEHAMQKINRWGLIQDIRTKGYYGAMGGRLDSPTWEWGYRPVRNGQDEYWPKDKVARICERVMRRYRQGTVACYSCPISCKPWLRIETGDHAIQGEGWWNNSANSFCTKIDNTHLESAIHAHYLSNQLGLDTDDAAQAVAWAFECYEKGLITPADTGGLQLTWGNYEAMLSMLKQLAFRRGFGALLADGALRAAKKLGRNSEAFVVHVKGQDSLDGVRINKGWGFGVVLSPVAGRHLRGSLSGFWLGGDAPINSYQDVPYKIYLAQQRKAVQDMLGYCSYVYGVDFGDWVALAAAAADASLSEDDLICAGLGAHNLEKAFNTLHTDFGRRDDYPCRRYYNEAVKSGPYAGEHLDHAAWDQMLDEHYRLHGWDVPTGLQTRKGLDSIGLADVADKLEALGRLK